MKQVVRLALLCTMLISALTAATLNLVPSSLSVVTGDTFTVDVNVTDVVDLYAYQFDVGFDPAMLSVSTIAAGPFLGTGGPTFFIEGISDNSSGIVSATAESLQSAIPGVTGSGTLARFTFVAVGPGDAVVSPFGALLLNSSLFGIDASAAGVTVVITGVPEPSTFVLVAGVLVLAWTRSWIVRRARVRIS